MPEHFFGWKRQQPDFRDFRFQPTQEVLSSLPPSVDLTAGLAPVLNQGQLGSCGPNAVDILVEFDQRAQGLPVMSLSRLFTYYTTRQLMGTTQQDSGVDNRTMLKSLNKAGFCDEALWPYILERFTTKPPQNVYTDAAGHLITDYAAVAQDAQTTKGCLASGKPFLFGFTVYESFESQQANQTGEIPMPRPTERVLGGHDVVIYGYDDATQRFKFRNSWGVWGNGGNGTIPYTYVLDRNLAGDFWVINTIPGGHPPPPPPPPGGDVWELFKNGVKVYPPS